MRVPHTLWFNVIVTILEPSPASSPAEQLCMDLVEIMTVFTNKIYGMRSNSNKKRDKKMQYWQSSTFDQLIRTLLKTHESKNKKLWETMILLGN